MEKNETSKNFSFVAIGRIVTIILTAVFYLVLAALLGPESYGNFHIIIALAGTFAIVSRFGLQFSLQIYQAKQKTELSNQINTLFLIFTSVAGLILLSINVLAAALCITLSFFVMNQQNLLGLKQYKKFMINAVLKSIIILIIPILFYFVLDIDGIIIGMTISNFISSIPYIRKIKLKSIFGLKKYFKVLSHNFGVDSSSTLPFVIDKLVMAPFFGAYIIGIYQLNIQILLAMGVIPGILSSYLLSEESSGNSHKKLSYLFILISIIFVIAAIFLSPFFVNSFFPDYSEGISSLQVLVFALIPLTVTAVFRSKLMSKESTRIGFSAIVRVGSLIILIPLLGEKFGLIGFSLAVVISISIDTIFLFFLYWKMDYNEQKQKNQY